MTGLELEPWELVCYCFIFVVGLIGNLTICLVVLKSGPAYRRVPFNIYLLALAVTDLTLAIVCLPIYIMSTATFPHPTGTKGDTMCKIITGYLLLFWLGNVSVYLLVVISFERYAAISTPLRAMTRRTSKRTVFVIVSAWLVGFIAQVPTIVGVDFAGENGTIGNHCSYNFDSKTTSTVIYAFVFTVQYIIPAIIIIVNFYRIRENLSKLNRSLRQRFQNLELQQLAKVTRRKKTTVRIVFVASVAFFICWTPNNIMYFLFQYGGVREIPWNSDVYQVGIILGFFNSCINPFIYAFQSKEFRSHCKKIFEKMLGRRTIGRQPTGISGSSNESTSSSNRTMPKYRLL